jgi:TolB protein
LTGCADPAALAKWQTIMAGNQRQGVSDVPVGNRLLVQGVDGNLYTMAPDGSDRLALTNDAGSLRQYLQPTWSPTGERIAWTEIDGRSGEMKSALIVSTHNGSDQLRFDTPFAPFYMFWSPDESRLAYLSNWLSVDEPSIALRLIEFATEEPIRTLAEGQPLYFSWAPDSTRLLAHIANERIEVHSVDGEPEPIQTTAAIFPSPQWSTDGGRLVYALGDVGGQRLVIADSETGNTTEITDFGDRISFTLSPSGEQLAYAVTRANIGVAAFGPLYVVDLTTLGTREISAAPVLAFFWSPDSSKLAYMAADESAGSLSLRWYVWDGSESRAYASVVPTRTYLQSYLAFFDQYAQSMTMWSPDSTAFAYAAVHPETGSGVWVQHLDTDAPERIGRGVFVAWSPR